jgi:acyl-CoA synthetase (AMP-forming)/AMP-acid ligase II
MSWSLTPRRHGALWTLPGTAGALAWLRAAGLRAGDRLGLGLAPTPAAAELIQAAVLGGIVLVPFHQRLDADAIAAQVAVAGLAGACADPGHPLARAWPACLAPPAAWPADADLPAALPAGEREALVVWTSGTTGSARAVRLPARALAHALAASCAHLGLGQRDVWLGCLPLDHIAGLGTVLRQLVAGYRLELHPRFDAAAIDAAWEPAGITGASLVPTQLHRLVAARAGRPWPAALRLLLTGGGPLDPALAAACAALGRAPCQTWGLSECCAMVTAQRPGQRDQGAGTPIPGMAVVALDGDGQPLPAGASGQLAVRGPALFTGYDPPHPGGPGDDGWYRTGDRGLVDAAGWVQVLGRCDEVVVCGGEKIDPLQVEARLAAHPAVAAALVAGAGDAEWGQVPVALLVAQGVPPSDADFAQWLADHLPGPWRPRRWAWVAELPLTALGKPRRAAVAAAVDARR